jgi:hypothetical protein
MNGSSMHARLRNEPPRPPALPVDSISSRIPRLSIFYPLALAACFLEVESQECSFQGPQTSNEIPFF